MTGAMARAAERPSTSAFTVPPGLQTEVDFWKSVFARYSKYEVVVHDTEHLDRVYSVLDFQPLAANGLTDGQVEQIVSQSAEEEKERIRALLLRLHREGDDGPFTPEEERIVRLFHNERDPNKFLRASAPDRIRAQIGLRERFARGIEVAHAYFPDMEEIFRQEGVPPEITRLTLVESCFNVNAYSKAGAAGVWQFLPATGRLYDLRIDDTVDDRRDPIASTRASARFLRQSYEKLGSWPLAIVSYNHGPGGVARGVEEVGNTDIVTIIRSYHGRAFKFASRNFFPEFLAALEVERDHTRYFGALALRQPITTDSVYLTDYVSLETVARCADSSPEEVAQLNPALSRAVYDGKRRIPSGYRLRLPAGSRNEFQRCYAALPPYKKPPTQVQVAKKRAPARASVVHRVRRGQTLSEIARRYGSTVDEIRRRNGIAKGRQPREGQLLRIPTG